MKIPWDLDSIRSRGAWLGIAYIKASGGDLQLLMKLCRHPILSKQVQNRIRLEMAILSLSKSAEIMEPFFREHVEELSVEAISQIKKTFLDGAWQSIKLFSPQDSDDMTQVYTDYINREDKGGLLWSRLLKHGMSIAVEDMRRDLAVFERTVLHGTALFLALDSLQVSQDEIEHAHDSFLKAIGG